MKFTYNVVILLLMFIFSADLMAQCTITYNSTYNNSSQSQVFTSSNGVVAPATNPSTQFPTLALCDVSLSGAQINLQVSGLGTGASVSWTAGSVTSTTTSIVFTPPSGTSHSVTLVVTGGSCPATYTIPITTSNNVPSATINLPAGAQGSVGTGVEICSNGAAGSNIFAVTGYSGGDKYQCALCVPAVSLQTLSNAHDAFSVANTAASSTFTPYTIRVSNSDCYKDNIVAVRVNATPTVSLPSITAQCEDAAFTVTSASCTACHSGTAFNTPTSSGSNTLSFSTPIFNTVINQVEYPITPSNGTNSANSITVTYSNSYGGLACSNTSSWSVTINKKPQLHISDGTNFVENTSISVCRGDALSLAASCYGTGRCASLSYQWSASNGVVVSSASASSTAINNILQAGGALVQVTITNSAGCQTAGIVNLGVKELPVPTIAGFTGTATQNGTVYDAIAVCGDDDVNLTANCACSSYYWSPGNTITNSTTFYTGTTNDWSSWSSAARSSPTLNYNPGYSRFAKLEVTGNNGCDNSKLFVVQLRDLPATSARSATPAAICAGQTVSLSVTPVATVTTPSFLWSTGATTANTSLTPTSSGNTKYTVTVTDSYGCKGKDSVYVQVNAGATVSMYGPSFTCVGSEFTLNTQATSSNLPITYQWSADGSNIAVSTSTYKPTLYAPDTVRYRVVVSDASSSNCKDTAEVVVIADTCSTPRILTQGKPIYCAGDTAKLRVGGLTANAAVRWATGDTTRDISVYPIYNGMEISVLVGINIVNQTSMSVKRIYNYYPQYADLTDSASCVNDASLRCGSPATNAVWDASAVPGQRCFCSYIDTTYTYSVSFQETGRDTFTVSLSNPSIALTAASDTICAYQQDSISFNCVSCDPSVTKYLWKYELNDTTIFNTGLSGASGGMRALIVRDTMIYLSLKDGSGCVSIDSALIIAKQVPSVAIAPSAPQLCKGQALVMSAQTSSGCYGCAYEWSTGATTQTISVVDSGTYMLTVTKGDCQIWDTVSVPFVNPPTAVIDPSAVAMTPTTRILPLCAGNPDTLFFNKNLCGDCNVVWNTGATDTFIRITQPGGYYAQAIDRGTGCVTLSNPIVAINSTEGYNSIATASPQRICNSTPVSVSVPPCTNCTYNWHHATFAMDTAIAASARQTRVFSTNIPGDYYAIITNRYGCNFYSSLVTVLRDSAATPIVAASTDTVCSPTQLVTLSTPVVAGTTYLWYEGASPISGATNASYTLTTNTTRTYKVAVTYPNGCIFFSNPVTINFATFSVANPPANETVCSGDSVALGTTLHTGWQYQWYKNGVAIPAANASIYYATQPGDYHALVTNTNGCQALTTDSRVAVSNVNNATASSSRTNICAGDSAVLAVSICVGCTYEWYRNGVSVTPTPTNTTYQHIARTTGTYYAVVRRGLCQTASNSITINSQNVAVPSIIANTTQYCNGVSPVLRTSACVGCSYAWLLRNQPIYGALNDTFYTVSDTGRYRVLVTYPSGCADTSAQEVVISGSFNLSLTSSNGGVICDSSNINLTAIPAPIGSNPAPCAGGCTYEWFVDGRIYTTSTVNTVPTNIPGIYQVRVRTNVGCQQESERDTIRTITLNPTVQGSSTSLCGGNPVVLQTSPCAGCTYQWIRGATLLGNPPSASAITVTTQGSYTVSVTQGACSKVSPPFSLNPLAGLNPLIEVTATGDTSAGSICAGAPAQLRLRSSCSACTYQWLIDTLPAYNVAGLRNIPAATVSSYMANRAAGYSLQVRDTSNNCLDTSNIISINQVTAVPSFALNFAPNNQLATSGQPVDMDVLGAGLTPGGRHGVGSYAVTPLFAFTPPSNLLGASVRHDTFVPSVAQPGNYLITYSYTSSGCTFSVSDVLQVIDAASVDVVNVNPLSVAYEACVGDTLMIRTANFAFRVDSVYLFNQQDDYAAVGIDMGRSTINPDTFASSIVFNQNIFIAVPDTAKGCYIRLVGRRANNAPDTATTAFVQIHNEPLSLSGLPATICSNGAPLTLTGTPAGGVFVMQKYPSTAQIVGVFTANVLNPTAIPANQYDTAGIDTLRVVYQYTSKYSNGNACPFPDTATQLVDARMVALSSVRFNPISVTQTNERLENLVKRVVPHTASPARWLQSGLPARGHQVAYGGSFTTPAGNPDAFLAKNAGVGNHTISYTIINGACSNTVSDVIQVLPAPTTIAVSDTVCRNIAPVAFGRDANYSYTANPTQFIGAGVTFVDTFNRMVVRTAAANRYLTVVNGNPGLEQFRYRPTTTPPLLTYDTVLVQYWYKRVEFNNGLPFDTVEYVVASFYQPVFIEDTIPVNILSSLLSPVYCEANIDILPAGTPSGGTFSLQGGAGAYATGAPLVNNILNSYNIHHSETANTNYVLTYAVAGVACQSRDTFNFLIPKPIDAAFHTRSGHTVYCNSAMPDTMVVNATGAYSSILLVNGVAQPRLVFTPTTTVPGQQLIVHQVTDTLYGCITEARDTFEVYPLPNVRIDTFATTEFCTNDSAFQFQVLPSPICIGATGGQVLREGFDIPQIPTGWRVSNVVTPGWRQAFSTFGGTVTYGVMRTDTTSVTQNAWLFTPTINMVAGRTYVVEYWLRVGDRNCQTCGDASMAVTVGQGNTPGVQNTMLANFPTLDDNYSAFFALQSHSFIAPASGAFNFAFHAYSSGRTVRTISIDTITVREITAQNCQNGMGTLSGVGFINVSGNDSTYIFDPSTVAPGNYTMRYAYSDNRGCLDSAVVPIVVKQHPSVSFTALNPTYCKNEAAVSLAGNPVGGVFNASRLTGAGAVNMFPNNVTYNTSVAVDYTPRRLGKEVIAYRYRDPQTECAATVTDTVEVIGIPDSAYINTVRPMYCENAAPVTLNVAAMGSPQAGTFYGAGVVNGAGGLGVAQFRPDSAARAMGRVGDDTLRYVYRASNGCVDTTKLITRIQGKLRLSFDLVPDSLRLPDSLCIGDTASYVRVRHQQWIGALGNVFVDSVLRYIPGAMTVTRSANPSPVLPAFGLGDYLDPRVFGLGWHHVAYTYTNPDSSYCTATIADSFRIDTTPIIYFTGLPRNRAYCENEPGGLLLAYPAYYPGSGYLQLGTRRIDSSFVYIDPSTLADSTRSLTYPITYAFTDLHGCTAYGHDSIQIRPYPRIAFTFDTIFCSQDDSLDLMLQVTPTGGAFADNLPLTNIIQQRYLALNINTGRRNIKYTYTNPTTLCSNEKDMDVTIYHTPTVDFATAGSCSDAVTRFIPTLTNFDSTFDAVTSIIWNYGDGNSTTLTPPSTATVPNHSYAYGMSGYYQPMLTVVNQGICSVNVQRNVTISPQVTLNRYLPPYVEDFETSDGNWMPEQVFPLNDTAWTHRLLANHHIFDPTNKAWVMYGKPTDSMYLQGARTHIYSPCFDFRNTWRPMISMNIWRDMVKNVDGTVLEYYDETSNAWRALGQMGRGMNWYNTDFILSRPGDQAALNITNPTGWTGESGGWENVRYRLDQFAGRDNVHFRLSFASAPNTILSDEPQGFAFDSVWIGERGRNVVLEHFTNYAHPDAASTDLDLYSKIFNNMNGRDILLLQYHTNITGTNDSIYSVAPAEWNSRGAFYGVQHNGLCRVDGTPRGDGTTANLNVDSLDLDMLQFPLFNVFVDPLVINGNNVTVSGSVQALAQIDSSPFIVRIVMVEDSVANQLVNQNSTRYLERSVVRGMLPDHAGIYYSGGWWYGQTLPYSETYTIPTPSTINPARLSAVVFIELDQDLNKNIFQAATTRDLTIYAYDSLTNVSPLNPEVANETESCKVFPNPALDHFNVAFDQPLHTDYTWQMYDMLGRPVKEGVAGAGTQQLQITTDDFSAGSYIFVIRNSRVHTQRQVVIYRP